MEIAVITLALVIVFFSFCAIGILSYVFISFGLFSIGKREEENTYPLAWIPCANQYLLGKIAFKSKLQGTIMLVLNIIFIMLSIYSLFICRDLNVIRNVTMVAFFIGAISSIYSYVARYKIYTKYSGSVVIMTVLDILSLGLLGAVFVFAIRNNKINS